jgi:D-serine deaminase-like pyridoxal phosphate-dependent protein
MNSGIQQSDTPSLLLDLDKFEENVSAMASFARKQGVSLRPHIKTHKSSEIVRRQIESGALPNLKLQGIFTHAGHSYAASTLKEIEQIGIY